MVALLAEVGIALVALAVAGAAAGRLGLSVIPAYIVVGVLLSPEVTAAVVDVGLFDGREYIEVLAELGVVFLLFFLGLEFSLQQLAASRSRVVRAGTVDFVVNFGVGVAIGVAFGLSAVQTLFVAGIVYISSSAIVTKSLIENGWVANPESEPVLGVLVFEDLLIAVYLALLSAVVLGGKGPAAAAVAVGKAFAFLGALWLVAWYGIDHVEARFTTDSDELFLLRVLGVTTLVAGAALLVGVSEAVAAFFVGTAFSQTTHADRIERVVAPTRDLFAAVFFFSIGLAVSVSAVRGVLGLVVVAAALTGASKLASGVLAGRTYDLDVRRSVRVGVALVPRGEFSLVLAALAVSVDPLGTVVPAFAVGYVLVMSLLGTALIKSADGVIARAPRFDVRKVL